MPTITQLPTSSTTSAADIIPVSQNGSTCAVSLGTLLTGTQPVIEIESSSLLGRTSVGAGSPEQVDIGLGLNMSGGTLVSTGLDHSQFPLHGPLEGTEKLVLAGDNGSSLLPVTALRSLFQPGTNISITASGMISAVAGGSSGPGLEISQLNMVSSASPDDLVAVSHAGVTYATNVAALLNGTTVSQVPAANTPTDDDTFLVAQASDSLVRQSLGSVASWLVQRVNGSSPDVVVVSTDLTLDPQLHNNKVLVFTDGTSLVLPSAITSNFRCDAMNMGTRDVALSAGIRTSSGTQVLPAGQGMRLIGVQYSGTSLTYALISGGAAGASTTSIPGQPVLVSVSAASSTSGQLNWTAPAGVMQFTYTVSYRQTGTVTWLIAAVGVASTQYTVTALTSGVSYDFGVTASTANGVGPISNVITITIPVAGLVPVSVPLSLNATGVTAAAAVLKWAAPSSGQAQSYTVEYRLAGASSWTSGVTAGTVLTISLSGLVSGQAYEWRVTAVDISGNKAVSTSSTFTTSSVAPSVTAITWNVVPAGPFAKGVGAIGVNAHVTPAAASVQYGVSLSSTIPPGAWISATYVNNDLWGAYISTPNVAGTYFVWAQGMDGSANTVSTQAIVVT